MPSHGGASRFQNRPNSFEERFARAHASAAPLAGACEAEHCHDIPSPTVDLERFDPGVVSLFLSGLAGRASGCADSRLG